MIPRKITEFFFVFFPSLIVLKTVGIHFYTFYRRENNKKQVKWKVNIFLYGVLIYFADVNTPPAGPNRPFFI